MLNSEVREMRKPTGDEISEAIERMVIKCEQRGNSLLRVEIEPRVCLVCLKPTWFAWSLEETQAFREMWYKFCIDGQHDVIKEDLGYRE